MIADRLAAVNARLAAACATAGRDPTEVRLVAVSKRFPAAAIREAYAAGHRDFGESYAQELRDKARDLADLTDLRWHFIGRLQVNKAKYVAPVAALVHAVGTIAEAEALVARGNGPIAGLLAVNVGREPTKGGVLPEEVLAAAVALAAVPGFVLRGLMALPPDADDPEASAPFFAVLADRLAAVRATGLAVDELSIGTSHDAHVAVRFPAGSHTGVTTWVRVGTAIFGERK